jgi:hypothetical protein
MRNHDLAIPGAEHMTDSTQVNMQTGRVLKRIFAKQSEVLISGFKVTRSTFEEYDPGLRTKINKHYHLFERLTACNWPENRPETGLKPDRKNPNLNESRFCDVYVLPEFHTSTRKTSAVSGGKNGRLRVERVERVEALECYEFVYIFYGLSGLDSRRLARGVSTRKLFWHFLAHVLQIARLRTPRLHKIDAPRVAFAVYVARQNRRPKRAG